MIGEGIDDNFTPDVIQGYSANNSAFQKNQKQQLAAIATNEANSFLRTKDFYNWIKKDIKNSPTEFYYFNVNFLTNQSTTKTIDTTDINKFLRQKSTDLLRLRYCIQNIQLPKVNFTAYDSSGNSTSNTTLDGSNMFGTYTIFGNSYLGISQKTFTMQILNTQSPIIESFIYPWMLECLSQETKYVYPFPRLDMYVKFYKSTDMVKGSSQDMSNILPQFIYYVRGMFPLSIQLYDPNHTPKSGDNNRAVDFAFNQFIVLPDIDIAKTFKLDWLFTGFKSATEQALESSFQRKLQEAQTKREYSSMFTKTKKDVGTQDSDLKYSERTATWVANAIGAALGRQIQATALDMSFSSGTNNTMETADPVFDSSIDNSTTSAQPAFDSTQQNSISTNESTEVESSFQSSNNNAQSLVNVNRNTNKAVITQISTSNTSADQLKNTVLNNELLSQLEANTSFNETVENDTTVQSKLQTLQQAVFQYQKTKTDQGDILEPVDQLKTVLASEITKMNNAKALTINKAKNAQLGEVKQGKLTTQDIDSIF